MKVSFLNNPNFIPLNYKTDLNNFNRWVLNESLEIELSDGRVLIIEKGFETDLSSIPSFLWGVIKPFDVALIAELIHDKLYTIKEQEIIHFGSVYLSRKFADNERNIWRKKIAKNKKIKNVVTNFFVRFLGGLYYRGCLEI